MNISNFSFTPEKYLGGQITDTKPDQKFEDKFDPIYECIQNSIDAKLNNQKVTLKISFKKVFKKDLNFFDQNFTEHVRNSIRTRDSSKIHEDRVDLLILEDFGTTGITGDPDEKTDQTITGKENNYFNMNFSFGGNQKLNDYKLGGSEGEGRQTFCLTSAISTFFYYSVDSTNNNKGCFFGISYLGKREINKQLYFPFAYFGKKVKNDAIKDDKYVNCFPVTDEKEILRLTQLFKLERKPSQSGLSVVVPFPSEDLKNEELLISKIIDVYRVTILRGQLEIHVNDVIINSDTILNINLDGLDPRKTTKLKPQQKDIQKAYYNFLDNTKHKSQPNYTIENFGEKNLTKENFLDFTELAKKYNNNELLKIRVNFRVKRIISNIKDFKAKTEDKATFAEFYLKKYPTWANILERCNDFIRGPMSIHRLRKDMQMFWLFDIQDEEASLFVKNAEKANHSDISSRNTKLERNYKSYQNTVIFLQRFHVNLFQLLSDQENIVDYEVTQDLFKIENEGGGLRKTDQLSEDSEVGNDDEIDSESIFGVNDIIVPPIFESLKYYEKNSNADEKKLTFQIVGQKYNKEEILKKIELVEKYIEATESIERSKYSEKELLRMDTKVNTFKRRLLEYKDYVGSGCTFYPRRIEIDAAFDAEGVGNPFRKYRIEDFDFGDDSQFKFELTGNVKLDKNNENKITIIAHDENYSFKVVGFEQDGQEDVRWRDRSYSVL